MNNLEEEYDYLFKILIIGDSGVGKSNLLTRFIRNQFNFQIKSTIGVQFGSKLIQHQSKVIKAQIWDTAGQERFRALTPSYYKGAMGILLVYDISKQESFAGLQNWVKETTQYADQDLIIVLVGNKSDLDYMREIPQQQGIEFAKQHNFPFFETSALDCTNVQTAFRDLLLRIARNYDSNFDSKKHEVKLQETQTVKLNPELKPKKSCCKKG